MAKLRIEAPMFTRSRAPSREQKNPEQTSLRGSTVQPPRRLIASAAPIVARRFWWQPRDRDILRVHVAHNEPSASAAREGVYSMWRIDQRSRGARPRRSRVHTARIASRAGLRLASLTSGGSSARHTFAHRRASAIERFEVGHPVRRAQCPQRRYPCEPSTTTTDAYNVCNVRWQPTIRSKWGVHGTEESQPGSNSERD